MRVIHYTYMLRCREYVSLTIYLVDVTTLFELFEESESFIQLLCVIIDRIRRRYLLLKVLADDIAMTQYCQTVSKTVHRNSLCGNNGNPKIHASKHRRIRSN